MKKTDTVIVDDKLGRRRFIRTGAAFLLASATTVSAQEESEIFRTDCDSRGGVGEKNPEMAQTDSDAGEIADRPGCGRKKPTLTEYKKGGRQKLKVGKVIA